MNKKYMFFVEIWIFMVSSEMEDLRKMIKEQEKELDILRRRIVNIEEDLDKSVLDDDLLYYFNTSSKDSSKNSDECTCNNKFSINFDDVLPDTIIYKDDRDDGDVLSNDEKISKSIDEVNSTLKEIVALMKWFKVNH